MNLFDLWMEPMFFVHLILSILGLIGCIYAIIRFKEACSQEQQETIHGIPANEYSNEEEEEDETPQEYEENEEGASIEDEEQSIANEEDTEDNLLAPEQEIQERENEQYPIGQNAENTVLLSKRIEITEKNLDAASKGFSKLVDRLTDLEDRLHRINTPAPIEKTNFADEVKNSLKEMQAGISALQAKTNNDSHMQEMQQKIEKLTSELSKVKQENNMLQQLQKSVEQLQKDIAQNKVSQDNSIIEELKKDKDISNKRLEKIEDKLQASIAGRTYTVDYLAKLLGDFDKINREEIRIRLKRLEEDLANSYKDEEDIED